MLDLTPHAEGTILSVRARAGGRQNEIRGEQDGMLKVCVTQAPERGKANKAIVALLSKSLALKRSQFELIAGETSPEKRFLVRDVTPNDLAERINEHNGFTLCAAGDLCKQLPNALSFLRQREGSKHGGGFFSGLCTEFSV